MATWARNLPRVEKLFYLGAAYSQDAELLGAQVTGEYIDARNARPNGLEGEYGALKRIYGEVLEYPSQDNSCVEYYGNPTTFTSGNWRCMLTVMVKTHVIEFWADANQTLAPFIRIDGVISAANPALPISVMHPPQCHWNHNCIQGEIYYTDNNVPPIILSVKDMIDSNTACSEKYFNEFDIREYGINLSLPPHKMVFIELANSTSYPADAVFGAGGLKVGMYVYTFRYVDATGNRTNMLPTTPCIPIPVSLDYRDPQYPGIKTYGAEPATQSGYGIVLQFRVQNEVGYSYVEVVRYAYNQGSAVGFQPLGYIIGRVPVLEDEVSIKTVLDMGEPGEPLPGDESPQPLGTIERCKSIRYFENVLTLHNVKYASNDLTGLVTFTQRNGVEMFPVIDRIGKIGHDDAWNGTYRRNFRRGEIYGFGVGFYGTQMEHTFVEKVTGSGPGGNFTSYQMPERRDEALANTQAFSYNGLPRAVTYQTNDDDLCHETYDLDEAVPKTICCEFINISCEGEKGSAGLCQGDCGVNGLPASCGDCEVDSPYNASDAGYQIMNPVWDGDSDVKEHDYRVNLKVCNSCDSGTGGCNGTTEYNPIGFAPRYYALGMALNGIDTSLLPDWVQGFTIVRTPKAGRIVAQGIGMYYLMPGNAPGTPGSKGVRQFWFYSSEAVPWAGLMASNTVNAINANAGQTYKAQLISPVGIFTEMPWGWNRDVAKDMVDICVYPRFYKDTGTINTTPDPVTGNGAGYVQFGKWRNDTFPAWIANLYGDPLATSKAQFNISGFRDANNNGTPSSGLGSEFIGDRGNQYMVLTVDTDVYNVTGVGLGACDNSYESVDTKNWHEPMYNINIVDSTASVVQSDNMVFLPTEVHAIFHKLIGIGDGAQTTFPLVDERWEDCRPYATNTYNSIATVDTNVINSLIHIELSNGTKLTLLNADNVTNVTLAGMPTPFTIGAGALSKPNVTIDGYYRTTATAINGLNRFYTVVFDAGYVPPQGAKIFVDYDDDAPIACYGGDTYIGDDVFAGIDRKKSFNHSDTPFQGITPTEASLFLDIGFPYLRMEINPRIYILNRAEDNVNRIQDCCQMSMSYLRQMIAVFNCESPIHLPYNHEGPKEADFWQRDWFFPATNYIQRPIAWDSGGIDTNNFCGGGGNIYDAYKGDYPHEYDVWSYGGYRWRPRYNIDYLHFNNLETWVTKPIGYQNQTEYCTRIAWSLRRDIGRQDVPSLKTFLPQNVFDLEDAKGEIKFAWSTYKGATGTNLYCVADRGICRTLTNVNILRDAVGNQVGVQKADQATFIGGEQWLNSDIGMNAEMYRSRAEYDNVLWFANLTGVYEFGGGEEIKPIYEAKYQARIIPWLESINGEFQAPAGNGSWITAFYDTKYKEYVLQIERIEDEETKEKKTFVYNPQHERWNGVYDYGYDQYLSFDNKNYGMGRWHDQNATPLARTYKLDQGFYINDSLIVFECSQAFTPPRVSMDNEFVDMRIGSSQVPDFAEVYFDIQQVNNGLIQAIINQSQFLDRNGWEAMFPRKNTMFVSDDNRIQGRFVIVKQVYSGTQEYILRTMSVSYKPLLIDLNKK